MSRHVTSLRRLVALLVLQGLEAALRALARVTDKKRGGDE